MEHYAGIDVSLELSSVCIVDAKGKIVREAKVASDPDALIAFFKQLGFPVVRIELEAGPLSQWLYAGLAQAGLETVLLETRHVKAALSAMTVKTDHKDARGIAQLIRMGWFRPVHCKSPGSQEVRALLVARKQLLGKLLDVELSIRGILRGFGLKMGVVTRETFEARARELSSGQTMLETVVGAMLTARKLTRVKMREFFSQIEPGLVGMEACGSAHYWARELKAMGHEVLLMPPAYTKPYVKRGKNNAVDADAICEAMSRPGMRFVPIKSAEQQAMLMLHKTRELLVKQRTMSVNALRGHLSEFGIVAAKGIGRVDELLDLAENDATLPNAARASVKVLAQALEGLDKAIGDLEKQISSAHAQNEMSRLLDKVPGIGKLIASVIAASVPDPSVFKSGRDFAAWLGLTPRQNSSGGKQTLGAITKQGNRYIRKLLVLGATSLLNVVGKRKGALRDWIVGLLAKKPARLVTVALANKLARILWAMMKTGECFRTETFTKA